MENIFNLTESKSNFELETSYLKYQFIIYNLCEKGIIPNNVESKITEILCEEYNNIKRSYYESQAVDKIEIKKEIKENS